MTTTRAESIARLLHWCSEIDSSTSTSINANELRVGHLQFVVDEANQVGAISTQPILAQTPLISVPLDIVINSFSVLNHPQRFFY